MKKFKTIEEVPYDEDLPYALLTYANKEHQLVARFATAITARDFIKGMPNGIFEILNTTPKPRIPEGAKYITWSFEADGDGYKTTLMAFRVGHPANKVWLIGGGGQIEEKYLLLAYPDSVFTELIEKENN